MKYHELTALYDAVSRAKGRLEKTFIVSRFIQGVAEQDLGDILLLLQGKVFPAWDRKKVGVSSRLVLKAIAVATGINQRTVEERWKDLGDLGEVAGLLIDKKPQTTLFSEELLAGKVIGNIRRLAEAEGKGAVDQKIRLVAELLSSATAREAVYVVRTVLEDLRVGLADGTMKDSIAWAFFQEEMGFSFSDGKIDVSDRKTYNDIMGQVQNAFDLSNDFGTVALAAKRGIAHLDDIRLKVGVPIKVMLGPKARSVEDALETVGVPAELEYKYDGFRMQIHKLPDGKIRIFTRSLEEVTDQFPEVVDKVSTLVGGNSFILDAEAVGFNPKTRKYLPFQHISQRIKRKYDIGRLAREYPVELNIFDIISHNGKDLLNEPFSTRRALLEKIVVEEPLAVKLAVKRIVSLAEEVEPFYQESLSRGNEGLMVKKLDAPYKPGSRVGYMVKLKPVMETLELVIVGAEWGEGKRAQWLASFTLACVGDDGTYLEIGKVGTGIKEKETGEVSFASMTELLRPLIMGEQGRSAVISPKVVVEVDYEEIQKSPTYRSGFALRFPRLVGIREDRLPEDASSLDMVQDLFFSQNK